MVATLKLRTDQLQKFRRLREINSDAELARRMGVDASTVSRVIQGRQAPGPKFMGALVLCFPGIGLDDLFEAIEDHAA